MKIPLLHHKPGWQRFLSGLIIGTIISWLIFLYFFAQLQEKNSLLVQSQKEKINELEEHLAIWQNDYNQLNER